MEGHCSLCVVCSLEAEYLIREVDTDTYLPMCQFHGIKEIVTTHRICELCELLFRDVLLKSSRSDWDDSISISECIQKTVEAQMQNSTEGQRINFCWLKSLLREIKKGIHLKELQIPNRTSLSFIHCIPLLPIENNHSLSLFLTDILRNWVFLENFLDVCENIEHLGTLNENSIAREYTWEIFKVTEELKRMTLMISDQTLYCVDSRVLTGLELCIETVEILRSRFLTTEEVASCTNSLGSYQYFSELTDSTQAFNLLTVLNGYSSLLRLRNLDLLYEYDCSLLRCGDVLDEVDYGREHRRSYIRALQKYFHLCPYHPDFKVALGMFAADLKLPAFIEWAEKLQTDLPLNDSLSLFLDSQTARDSTTPELMHASRERFQDNYVMNRILVAKWLSLIPYRQTESLEELFRSESLAASYPHLVANAFLKYMSVFLKNSTDALHFLRKTAEIMKHEPKFANKCAICYFRQAQMLVTNQGSQLKIDSMTYRALKVSNNWKILEYYWELIIHAYFKAQRFADLEHFVIFSKQVFPTHIVDMWIQELGMVYQPLSANHPKLEFYFSFY